jgi:tRNA/tmRNA/rRNA uracil-C5-methylase (TrmA/RlmC/RlmD family)
MCKNKNNPVFADLITPLIPKPNQPQDQISALQGAPLAHVDYAKELLLKDQALSLFWQRHNLSGTPEPVIASPRPSNYRTTSKRKTILRGSTLHLIFGKKLRPTQKSPFQESPLEPPEHGRIYSFLQKRLSEPAFKLLAGHLNYIIIRGNYQERAVIFNVDTLNGPLIHKLKIVAKQLQNGSENVIAAYIYPDPSCSDYYLENRRPADLINFKKLFGKANLTVTIDTCRLSYHPTSFSQINESMLPVMLNKAKELLLPDPANRLLDLYCGYGLFSHFLASEYKNVVGIDVEGPSIRAAMANGKKKPNSSHTKFIAHRITGTIDSVLPSSAARETIILDPPRQGPHKDVISTLSRRKPNQVLHIFCGVDQIPASLHEWQDNGYQPDKIVPLDMFAGTANLEVLILLKNKA